MCLHPIVRISKQNHGVYFSRQHCDISVLIRGDFFQWSDVPIIQESHQNLKKKNMKRALSIISLLLGEILD